MGFCPQAKASSPSFSLTLAPNLNRRLNAFNSTWLWQNCSVHKLRILFWIGENITNKFLFVIANTRWRTP